MINEILQGRFNKALQRFFAIKGAAPAPQLTPEVGATIDLLSQIAEMFYLRDEKINGGGIEAPATVGQASGIILSNPSNSGILVIPTLIWFHTNLAGGQLVDWFTVFGGVSGVLAAIEVADTRQANTGAGFVTRSVVTVAFTNKFGTFQQSGPGASGVNDQIIANPAIVLSPGFSIMVQGQTLNAGLGGGFLWRERPASAEEFPSAGTG